MALYTIGDLHLSLSGEKPMDVFGGVWNGYVDKLKRGLSVLAPDDVLVICGDISWGMSLQESREDFAFLDALPGKKIFVKGNHDYWWSTAAKMKSFFAKYGFSTLDILHNNCHFYKNDIALCGTRGWFFEEEGGDKVFRRELLRLETSLKAAGVREKFCFFHYPPCYEGYCCPEMIQMMKRYQVKKCFYGHLHGKSHRLAVEGEIDGIEYALAAADYLRFSPIKIIP